MKGTTWMGLGVAAIVAAGALTFAACGGDDNDDEFDSPLNPGPSSITGTVSTANTNGDTSLAGITVTSQSDQTVTTTTNASGAFSLPESGTGDVIVSFSRGVGCESSFVLGNVISNSSLTLANVTVTCGAATVGTISEVLTGVIHEDPPGVLTPIDTCVRVGDDNQFRDIDASSATVLDVDGSATTFEQFADENLIEATGTRPAPGAAGVLDASEIRILEGDVNDPCEVP
jgi:hypothetical protein